MAADRLTKPLIAANFEVFVKINRVKDKKNLLTLIKREEKPKKIF